MGGPPSLSSLCMEAVKREILCGDDLLLRIYNLPPYVFDCLLTHLPPLALQKLQDQLPFEDVNDHEYTSDVCSIVRKRGRSGKELAFKFDNFNEAWRALFVSRWPKLVTQTQQGNCLTKQRLSQFELTGRWREKYWEAHLQNCLDEAVEVALLPSFGGCLSEIKIPDLILKTIGCEEQTSHCMKLSYHCQQFGYYARCLRLQNVLCCLEISNLLSNSKLERLVLCRIISKEHVDGLCKLLNQNNETLMAIELMHCRLSSTFINTICDCLCMNSEQTPMVQHFSVRASSFLETNPNTLPYGLVSLLTGRHLCSLKLCENHLGRNFAAAIFYTLLDASSNLSVLDLSENNIRGWLSNFNGKSVRCSSPSLGQGKIFQSLRVLNLRGNNLRAYDVGCLKDALVYMPKLETLDISDNPLNDDGIENLFPYFVEASEGNSHFTDLKLENCDLSCNGVTQLLGILSTFTKPLSSLSIADNDLGSHIAAPLGKFLGNFIKELNIKDIGLGSSGFLELQKSTTEDVKLVHIDLSNNCGGIEAAIFLSKLLLLAPDLVEVNAGCNLMPADCMTIIFHAIEYAKGKIQCLDLRGNYCCCQPAHASMLAKFQHNGKPIVLLSVSPSPSAPYDDDP